MSKLVKLTININRTFPIDNEIIESIPDISEYTEQELIELCTEIWVDHMPDDILDHIHGEVIYDPV